MAYITAEPDLDELDDWFKIGAAASQTKAPEVLARSALGGRQFDPETGSYVKVDEQKVLDSRLPRHRRGKRHPNQNQYIEEYRQQEYDELMSQTAASGRMSPTSVSGQLEALELDSTVLGSSVAMPEDLIPEGATDVYKNYRFLHQYAKLPILEARDEIVSTIESNQVTVIQGPTGSGKTTQIPQFILDHYAEESRYCNIIVTQPRKIAAMSVSKRVCEERGWELGSVCGYQIALDRHGSEDTRILYCTTGILKEKLIAKKNMHEFTHIMLDEVHERDIESDFALLLVKKLLRTNSPHVKVIVTSATFDTQDFAQYFALPVGGRLEPAPVIQVGTVHHQVSEFFADDLTSKLGEVPPVDEMDPCVHPAMYDMAVGLIKEFDLLEEKEQGKDTRTGFAPVRGTVLIFLPGYQEIRQMCDRVGPYKDTHFLVPIPLHSSITVEEQNKVFVKPAQGYRKIIISTNIAESSITVPDIKYVIDFCLTKNLCCDPDTNYTQLQLEWASKANTRQRKGRAGRVSNGRVYYMVPRWFYERVLPDFGIPEMQRSPLESLILKTKIFEMGEPKALLALALSPPNLDDIERTVLSLKEIGALSTTVGKCANPYDGDLTFIGRVLAGLPCDVRIGKLLILGHVFGVLEECIILGAAMSVKSIFANPMDHKLEAFKAKISWSDNSLSDCIAILNAYKVWESRLKMEEFKRSGANEFQWGSKSFIQIKAIREVHHQVQDLEKRLLAFNILKPTRTPDYLSKTSPAVEKLILKMVLCGAFYPNFAVKNESDEGEAVKFLSNNDPSRTVMVKGLPANQGILYEKQIRNLFSTCWKDPPPIITFEETRAFITFPWKQGTLSEGKIHPAVYTAIKIRQLGLKLAVDLLDKDEVGKRLDELRKTTSSLQTVSDLRTNRILADTDLTSTDSVHSLVNIDPQITTLLINVTEVVGCGHLWGQCDDARTKDVLIKVQNSLNNPHAPLSPITHKLLPNQLVAAPYQDGEECYYRARIEELKTERVPGARGYGGATLSKALVFFVDFGNKDWVHTDRLRTLPGTCENLPYAAIEFHLKGIRPSNVKCADGVWSQQANHLFENLTLNKNMFAQVFSIVNNTVRVDLVARYPTGQEICLNDELIEQGFAEKAEESFLSEQNHQWREEQRQGNVKTNKPGAWLNVPTPSKPDHNQRAGGRRRGRKVNLTGPTNPLEASFSSMTLSGRQRVVRIDPDSVNCVAIDDDPRNKFSRLMVASFIGLNSAGNTMVARNTTILPQIPGLPALVTLLFAPYTEYRTDPQRKEYIGAICGLGYDEDNLPILPDHDIELTFETEFTTQDIAMINEVRMAINIALGTDSAFGWGQNVISSIQERARTSLLDLLKKLKPPREPKTFPHMYKWNRVDPAYVLHHNLRDTTADSSHLLRLHNAIALVGDEEEKRDNDEKEKADMKRGRQHRRQTPQALLKHHFELEQIANSHVRKPVHCEICNVTVTNSQILAIHIQTDRHLQNVKKLQESMLQQG
ncbi:hypothetical protein EGW08_007768 [Elysia chlorotica]|uniref:RNA helicase n=1 Tax=Elysia chlorotica TaxID=188477 RepID=A0A433TSA7_ELYCH|nr:hypothetical protein EGW08_007768 [Elysia chlorotica]